MPTFRRTADDHRAPGRQAAQAGHGVVDEKKPGTFRGRSREETVPGKVLRDRGDYTYSIPSQVTRFESPVRGSNSGADLGDPLGTFWAAGRLPLPSSCPAQRWSGEGWPASCGPAPGGGRGGPWDLQAVNSPTPVSAVWLQSGLLGGRRPARPLLVYPGGSSGWPAEWGSVLPASQLEDFPGRGRPRRYLCGPMEGPSDRKGSGNRVS